VYPILLSIYVVRLVRIIRLKPRNKPWLQAYFIVAVINVMLLIAILIWYLYIKEVIILAFESIYVSLKFFWSVTMIISVLHAVTMITNLVVCSQLLYGSGYDAHSYSQMNNPSHHVMSQVDETNNLDQSHTNHQPMSSSNQYTVDTSADAKLIVDV